MKEKMQISDNELSNALRALAHPARLNILRVIAQKCNESCCCTDVTNCFDLAQSTVSQHIKVLLDAKMIKKKPQGTRNCYTVCQQRLSEVQQSFTAYVKEQTIKSDNNE